MLRRRSIVNWRSYSGIPVADVAKAYHISDFTPLPVINLPLNVFLTLTWTWMGAPAPFGPDIHANVAGYAVIAGALAGTDRAELHISGLIASQDAGAGKLVAVDAEIFELALASNPQNVEISNPPSLATAVSRRPQKTQKLRKLDGK
jgi:hypothetical protein